MFRWLAVLFLLAMVTPTVAQQDSLSDGSKRRIDGVSVAAKVTTWGVSLIADPSDSMWVQINFPLASSSGAKRDSVVAEIAHMQQTYKYYATATVGRYRLRWDNAKRVIERLTGLLP